MEIVVLNSDIARLVLDYLKSQKLKKATHTFCKTSPYLKQEFSAYKQGLQTHSFFPELQEIICEYVKISRKVEQLLPKLTDALRSQLQPCKLSEKVNALLERGSLAILGSGSSNLINNKNDLKSSVSTAVGHSQSNNTGDEKDVVQAKRKRSFETSNNTSNDEVVSDINSNKRHKLTASRLGHYSKKRRVLQPYCFLNAKALQRHKRRYYTKACASTTEEDVEEEEEEDVEEETEGSSNDNGEDVSITEEDSQVGEECDGDELFNGEKPTKESTPRNRSNRKSENLVAPPILPEISQAILDNPEFQQKLVENINQALTKSSCGSTTTTVTATDTSNPSQIDNTNPPLNGPPLTGEEITSSQLLDQMIKNILDATEKEPSFNDIIQEVVEAANKPQVQSASIQCNINTNTNLPAIENVPLYSMTEPPPLVPAQMATQLQIQQIPVAAAAATSPTTQTGTVMTTRNMLNIPAINVPQPPPPRTPVIIRSAPGVATAPNTSQTNATALTAQDPPSMLANNSFGPLIDPNFSISKLIVLNSNDSAQKQHPENCIGNTTADNLISQLNTSGVVDPSDEQVYFDTTTGQLTFPIFLTNDGLLTNFPFLINNEIVNQQLQNNNLGNLDGSRLEIPLAEPIMVSANQLPPNSIILSSALKEPVNENPETVEKTTIEPEVKHCNTVPPTSSDNRLLYDKATPSSSGIVNTKAFKSLSTPRKRTSHVRTLTFSPRDPNSLGTVGTPLSTRREAISRFQRTLPKVIAEEDKVKEDKVEQEEEKMEEKENNASEKAVIKTVEILPTIAASSGTNSANSETLNENTSVSANESSNIPPLFVSEESSNQTIINKHVTATKDSQKEPLKPKSLTNITKSQTTAEENTPKRKQFRKTAVRSCKRQLSKSSNEEDLLEEDKAEKENEKTQESPQQDAEDGNADENDMMQQWIRFRSTCQKVDLDVRLREINASTQSKVKKVNTKKRVRRKKPAAIKKKEKQLAKEAEELERSRELHNESQEQLEMDGEIDDNVSKPLNEKKDDNNLDESHNKESVVVDEIKTEQATLVEEEKQKIVAEKVKVAPTQNDNVKTAGKTIKPDKKSKEKQKKAEGIVKPVEAPLENSEKSMIQNDSHPDPIPQNLAAPPPHVNEALEREKRTTNIAFLLETPFKDPNLASCIPPTPGIFAPSLETPAGKQKDPHDEMQASASFLFGSITKSELDTPLMSAITPGFRFTPFGLKDIGTPKSIPGTDYSSGGGSYYKPDESEDLDRNIDKMLRNSAQKKPDPEEANDTDNVEQEQEREEGEIVGEQVVKEVVGNEEMDKIEIEIPIEKLKVEPIVLKRIKSFGTEAVDSMETAKIDPHYTLVSGLPEISAAEEEEESSSSSSSSSGSSTSSKSSSSSSSSCSSSSSSSSSSSNASVKSKTVVEAVSESNKKVNINDLENLSEISSTEDEEWQKLAVTDNDENSQLVSNDGEVRYPVRSWLTPIKENMMIETKPFKETQVSQPTMPIAKPATMKVTLPLKSAEKRNRQVKELELKKERMKEKLKNDATTTSTKKDKPITTSSATAPNISAALAASRMIHAMRDKGKKPACFQNQNNSETPAAAVDVAQTPQDKRSIDVLTALNLSAKKHLPKTPENQTKPQPRVLSAEENVMAKSPEIVKGKSKLNVSPSNTNKTPQRKCLPIEARPVTRTIRKSGKKIVRTPLAFKVIHSPGKINSHSTTTTLAEFAASKTLNKSKETTTPFIQQTLRVSPRLMKPTKLRGRKPAESPVQKTKANTRNTKTKTAAAAAKPAKAARTRSNNKKKEAAAVPLEKEMKELLEDWKEESLENKNDQEEFEDETEENLAAAVKPKIHLKARNAMISNKPKTETKKEKEVEVEEPNKNKDNKVLDEEVQNKQQEMARTESKTKNKPETQTIAKTAATNTPQENDYFDDNHDDNDDDDDDPLEDCEITTFDETDTKRFISYTYNGPDGPPAVPPQRHDFTNFQMVVAIDENEKHIWRISEGICLFSCAPSLPAKAAAIPKKRRVRATSVTTVTTNRHTTVTAAPNTKIAALKAFSTNNPTATSTPVTGAGSTSRTIAENGKTDEGGGSKTKTAITTKAQPIEAVKKPLADTSIETPKIQNEDIELILSHLHGT